MASGGELPRYYSQERASIMKEKFYGMGCAYRHNKVYSVLFAHRLERLLQNNFKGIDGPVLLSPASSELVWQWPGLISQSKHDGNVVHWIYPVSDYKPERSIASCRQPDIHDLAIDRVLASLEEIPLWESIPRIWSLLCIV